MKDPMVAISAAIRRARTVFTRPEALPADVAARRNSAHTIGQLISALNDRNVGAAMCLLEPQAESSEPWRRPDHDGSARRRCVGCGE
jgi:hypothetical protein